MKRLFPVLLMLLMILSACSSEGYVTEPDIPNETHFYNYQFDMPSQSTPIGPYAESFADGVSGRIYYGIDSNGNMFLIGTEPATEPDVPTTPAAAETTTAEPETTSAAETLPIETTEESVPDTLPVETTEEPTETPDETTEETSSETLPEETTTEEETTEEETTPAPTPAPTSPPPTTPKATEPKETDPPNPVMSNGKTQIWIDVDLSKQRVTIYNGDKEMNSFPCVTGCVNDGFGTPTGTFSILSKSRNRMLGGSSFVKYWMPFYQDYGLHDASWRKGNFRSDHAYYYGSHGCVNMPEEGAQYIWNNCPRGTTVIVHGTVKNPGKHTGHDLSGPWEVEVEATCTEPGRMVQYCPYCYAVASNPRVIPATGHQWGDWQTVNGVRQRVCSRCGLTETEGQHSHVWSAWTSDNDKTHTRSCTSCSDKQTENHKFESVITPATTDTQGYTTYTCTDCGFSYKGDYTDVHVHSYSKWTYSEDNTHSRICTACGEGKETEPCTFGEGVVTPPTETSEGYTTYTCTVCGYSYRDNFTDPIHVHSWGDWSSENNGKHSRICSSCNEKETMNCSYTDKVVAPTETAQGYTLHTCSVCGYSYKDSYTDPLGHTHSWGAWSSDNNGKHSRICSSCNEKETVNCSYTDKVIAPTETAQGYTLHTCSVCGYSYKDNYTDPTGHNHSWGSWTSNNNKTHSRSCSGCSESQTENCTFDTGVVTAPTETAQGYTTYTCTVCGYSYKDNYTDPIPHNHSWGSWTSNNNKTHSRSCGGCGESQTENCSFTDEVIAPTESSQGYTKHTCTVCGYSYNDNYTDPIPHNHSWGSWTSNNNGTHTHSCTGCSESETVNCTYGDGVVTPPTTSSQGYTTYTCTVCGYSYQTDFVPAITPTEDPNDTEP
jgi:lipoprotein-anchoring transpeptidase ErfK/SrfK/rubredoxin